MNVKISEKNNKMGKIRSVSLPAVTTCRSSAPCFKACYARKMSRYTNVKNAYEHNLDCYRACLEDDNTAYFDDITADIERRGDKVFRWNVSGDLPDSSYLAGVMSVADRTPNTIHYLYTKKYELVNRFFEAYRSIWAHNLVVIFSQWDGLIMPNPHNFPVATVSTDPEKENIDNSFICHNDKSNVTCDNCPCPCYLMEHGETVIFRLRK